MQDLLLVMAQTTSAYTPFRTIVSWRIGMIFTFIDDLSTWLSDHSYMLEGWYPIVISDV